VVQTDVRLLQHPRTQPAATLRGRDRLIALLASVGGACVIAGAALPWLSVYHGLDSYSGIAGRNGQLLVAGGSAVVLGGLLYARHGTARLRYLIGAIGFGLALFSGYLLAELLALDKQLNLHGFFLPALGPGLFTAGAGALLVLGTLFVDVAPAAAVRAGAGPRTGTRLDPTTVVLVSLSAAAGTVHLTVAADHFAEYFLFGLFFILAGSCQVAWAALTALAGPTRPLLLLATGNALVVLLWIVSRTSGVPLGPDAGAPEKIGYADTLTSVCEALLVAYVLRLLIGRRSRAGEHRALWAVPLLIAPATALAVLSSVGAIGFLPASG
jgi:hypothetical protein